MANICKKSQLTIFIILGIIMLFVIGITLFFVSEQKNIQTTPQNNNIAPIKQFIGSCLDNMLLTAINHTASQGGYYFPAEKSIMANNIFIPYYLYNKTLLVPSKKELEMQLSYYLESNIDNCLNTSYFNKNNISIYFDSSKANASVILSNNSADIILKIPIKVEYTGKTYFIDSIAAHKKTKFLYYHQIAKDIAKESLKLNSSLPLSYIAEKSSSNNFDYELVFFNSNTTICSLIFPLNSKNSIIYNFALTNQKNAKQNETQKT